MKMSLRIRIVLAVLGLLLGGLYALPALVNIQGTFLARILPESEIRLGLDLQGGMHLTLGVDIPRGVANTMSQIGQDIRSEAQEDGIFVLRPQVVNDRLEFTLARGAQQDQLERLLRDRFNNLQILTKEVQDAGQVRYAMGMTGPYRAHLEDLLVDQAIKTIRNRIDQFGVSEPDIRRQAEGRIQVQLPGLQDPERAVAIIGRTAHLEFKLVDDQADLERALRGILPPDAELAYMQTRNPDGSISRSPIVIKRDTLMTGEFITDARVSFDQFNMAYVGLNFNARGARLFERITGENTGRRLAIVLDGNVHSAPVIQERISGGRASISGRFTTDEATDLALVLRAGALPAPVHIMEERTVGPSLGQESIERGLRAALFGGALILVFMLVYYSFSGIVANAVLCLNLLLVMAGLAAFGATLTLPGIAGIILTIGIAVDANVLIFERIREEIRRGLTPGAAIDEGYGRALKTILDANVTTVIAAVVLYQFGTGPIRGFAVTLILGILASMFTAVFVSRIFFDFWLKRRKPGTALSI
ncbi:preprotein translocase subunit SecD [Desulfonatronum thiosulfatophilum]|uniref:Protein translocase subunit SecD n=1 Tax=Desulfonatronum thiosulfatophilum TaxID=617002 RepID=A0A1G6E958_9BACT|nr:protein translocase subunit SecD [Desulfonatronum thiosulfatophilum]SDB53941.1 preprotein translocase subunit SecD [Desulfonatronum thiosulfatophilum]